MEGVMWSYGLASYLSFLCIFSVFCSFKALELENGKLVDHHLQSSNKSLPLADELVLRPEISERQKDQEQNGLAPDYIFAHKQIHSPKPHSWIGELVPKVTIIIVVITVVAVAICCAVHVVRPDLFKSQRFKEDESMHQQQNGNINL
ncbi:hypothetical protein SUGI_0383100 [Cryptomeria japonica]|nr:hypothetical protein SUGI_0383100 [Cryptomeria japonica]